MDKITKFLIDSSFLINHNKLDNSINEKKKETKKEIDFDFYLEQSMILLSGNILCNNICNKEDDLNFQKVYKYERKIEAVCNDKLRKY